MVDKVRMLRLRHAKEGKINKVMSGKEFKYYNVKTGKLIGYL